METDEDPAPDGPKEKMFQTILSAKNAFFKSQQKNDPELDEREKMKILHELFDSNKSTFLQRYGKFLEHEHICLFQSASTVEYEVQHHLTEIQFRLKNHESLIRNRRFMALKRMIEKGEYFSESEMMRREPILYENLVGQYLSAEEKRERDFDECPGNSLVNMIYQGLDNDEQDKRKEDEFIEEFDSSDSENEEDKAMEVNDPHETPYSRSQWGNFEIEEKRLEFPKSSQKFLNKSKEPKCIMAPEKHLLKEEFAGIMYSNFISGKDKEFDYTEVDQNSEFDDEELRSRDLEEKYFEGDDTTEEVVSNGSNKMQQDEDATSEEDLLDVFMSHLNEQIHQRDVQAMSDKLEFLEKE